MKKTETLEYMIGVLNCMANSQKEVGNLEAKFGEENFSLRVMLEMLKV
jgi:ophiobolin F synthase